MLHPVKHGIAANSIRDRQNAQGDAVRVLQGSYPADPFPQESVGRGAPGNLNGNRPVGGLQPVDDDVPVRRGGMGVFTDDSKSVYFV